jgi:integrase
MQHQGTLAVSGHVFCVKRKCGPQFYVKYRVGGTQIQKRLGPAWLDQGRPPPGHYTKQMAEAALAAILADARRGAALHSTSSAVTVSEAAHEWLRHSEWERGVKASTLREYRSVVDAHIVTRFGDQSIETVTARQVEAWAAELLASGRSRRTVNKILTMLHGVFECARRVWNLPSNPVAEVARRPERYSGDLDFFSPEEVMALVHAAQSEQDAAILPHCRLHRPEKRRAGRLALARRPFRSRGSTSFSITRRSACVRATAMGRLRPRSPGRCAPFRWCPLWRRRSQDSVQNISLAKMASSFLAWAGNTSTVRRYDGGTRAALKRAGLRELRFHDLRHCLGSLAINVLSIIEVQQAMGHADVKTTMRYLHAKSRGDEARRLAAAFSVNAEIV